MNKLTSLFGLFAILVSGPTLAGQNMSSDLAAPYVHLAPANTYTTHYIITNSWNITTGVTIKCYNSLGQRVGPAAGTSYTAAPHGINVFSPVTLGLTSSPNFGDGIGWCYFAGSRAVAVTYLMGVADNGNLIPTNNARGISADTAQQDMSAYGSLAYWTQEAGWKSYLLALYPRPYNIDKFTMNVFNTFGNLQGVFSYVPAVRDIDAFRIPDAVGTSALFGSAEVEVVSVAAERTFMGWVIGYNEVSNESFQYSIPLLSGAIAQLGAADRP